MHSWHASWCPTNHAGPAGKTGTGTTCMWCSCTLKSHKTPATWHGMSRTIALLQRGAPVGTHRTCAATAVPLHLVGPIGFSIEDTKLKRAGLDYWPHVCCMVHGDWDAFKAFWDQQAGPKRLVAFSKFGRQHYASPGAFARGDWLLFGAETSGLPPEVRWLVSCFVRCTTQHMYHVFGVAHRRMLRQKHWAQWSRSLSMTHMYVHSTWHRRWALACMKLFGSSTPLWTSCCRQWMGLPWYSNDCCNHLRSIHTP